MKTSLIGIAAFCALLAPAFGVQTAHATPQIAVRSADACDTCHVEPIEWQNPELEFRKCSLNCSTCHVIPTGAGMRNESGLYYGRVTLPMFLKWEPSAIYQPPILDAEAPEMRGDSGSQPSGESGSQPSGDSGSQPSLASGSQPSRDSGSRPGGDSVSQPTLRTSAPAAGTKDRFGGIEPSPDLQVGADYRGMAYFPNAPGEESAVFPMELDLELAYRPYNPRQQNEGRVTVYAAPGFLGARDAESYDSTADRLFLREYWAMYHDLPYQFYARVGRFLPAFGWKTDDHTTSTRQVQSFLGSPFDHERQVTGAELGINPNYLFAHFSVFNASNDWKAPIRPEDGYGMAVHAGYRDLPWQAAGSMMVGRREGNDQQMLGANGAINLRPWGGPPLSYLTEYMINRQAPKKGEASTGLAVWHELNYLLRDGLNLKTRYEWRDANVDNAKDTAHRMVFGLEYHVVRYVEIIAQYRHNWQIAEERFSPTLDEGLLQLHLWY